MKTVHKFTLEIEDEQTIRTAGMLSIVHVEPTSIPDYRGGGTHPARLERINVWAVVDTEAAQDTTFYVHGTGHPIGRGERHQGTAVMPSGLVWHVFVIPERTFRHELY